MVTSVQPQMIKYVSYNMHGYYNGLSVLHELCKSYDIVLIKEHWLQACELDKLNLVNINFNCATVSAMDAKCASGILRGRHCHSLA